MPLVTITDWEYGLLQIVAAIAFIENLCIIGWIVFSYMHEDF